MTAQLIRTATDTHLWANEYDGDARDFLQVQHDIARAIVEEIRPRITREESARLATVRQITPEAREAYMLGEYHLWKANEASLRNAIAYFDRAVTLQPDYAAAYAGAALSWVDLDAFQDPHAQTKGRTAAVKALELDPNTAEAHVAIAMFHVRDWRWVDADVEFRKALDLNPDSVEACVCYANLLGRMGRISDALNLVEHGKRVNPLSTAVEWQYGIILYYARRYDEATSHLLRAIELDSQNSAAYLALARVYEVAGRPADAMAILDRPEFRASAEMGVVHAMLGRRADAEKILRHVKTGSDSVGVANLYFQLGNKDLGFEWLGKALEERHPVAPSLKISPRYDDVRSDRRFAALVTRLNLPD
jgi:serine/threonine-protein kinase